MEKHRKSLFKCVLPQDVEKIIAKLAKILELKSLWGWKTQEIDKDIPGFYIEGHFSTPNIILRAFFYGPKNFSTESFSELEIDIDVEYYVIHCADELGCADNPKTITLKIWRQMLIEACRIEEAEERAREKARQDEILVQKQAEAEKILNYLGTIIDNNFPKFE